MNDSVLVFGAQGMLATSLSNALASGSEAERWMFCPRSQVDITDQSAVEKACDVFKPGSIVNTAAYTDVRGAQTNQQQAYAVNAQAPEKLARICAQRSVHLVHFSTDYVFSGPSRTPWVEDDPVNPVNEYGKTKLAGEEAIRASNCSHCIVRSAWLYAAHGKNFVRSIAALLQAGKPLTIVDDQIGSPTSTDDLARWTIQIVNQRLTGALHAANAGAVSWMGIAKELAELLNIDASIAPTTGQAFDPTTPRPEYSVLDTARFTKLTGIVPRPWQEALADVVSKLTSQPT